MNVVLIPCFDRPEFLSECLKNIEQAESADQYHYIFRLDHGHEPDNLKVIEGFKLSSETTFTPRTTYGIGKQSYSVLSGLQIAAKTSDHLVFLIEDDVMIGRDFFRWHEEVHSQQALFSSHANLNVNSPSKEGWIDEYYLTTRDYGSIGTCMTRESIALIDPHINADYFLHPVQYIRRKFKNSFLGYGFAEQDGLIRRIQADQSLPQAYPCHLEHEGLLYGPRCFHAGFIGKGRIQQKLPGTAEQRQDYIQKVIYDQTTMRHVSLSEGYYLDSRPCSLILPEWKTLKRKG